MSDAQRVWRVGIDAGSKTIKVVVLDEGGSIVYSAYRRHRTNIIDTLHDLLHDAVWVNGDILAHVCVTGSAGISVSKLLGLPFVQEVVATTEAVKRSIPDADAIIELGGEDAKVVYLTGGLEQRMNATCAGGTGGFIDTIAFMLGVRTHEMSSLALGAQRTYPIASRCAVFAQIDVRPLLNEGASKADIAASALDAVVRQTLGGLACGRPLKGKVVFLGGPFEYIPDLVNRFRKALGLDWRHGIKPKEAHLFTAMGAAWLGRADAPVSLADLEARLVQGVKGTDMDDIPRLHPLFSSDDDLRAFRERHARCVFPSKRAFDAEGPLYLGIDSGSTTVKIALIDAEGNLLHSDYQPSRGDVTETVRKMLCSMHRSLPVEALPGHEAPFIANAVATGYGEEMMVKGFGADSGVVETTAHVRAAQHLCPDVSFVLDIGGQDMKALWLSGANVSDAVLNEACSSGCGAFIEGTAHALHVSPSAFADTAMESSFPIDLGMRCTVFMSSRVKHAQKAGASVPDIAAGVAYSVVHNALYRIIGADRLSSMGDRVVVQGGAFKSDAVLRAFEMTCGVQAIRPDRAHLMGAIGAALVARDRAQRAKDGQRSGIATLDELNSMKPTRTSVQCVGCSNACQLTIMSLGAGREMVSGNRCDGWRLPGEGAGSGPTRRASKASPPLNLIACEQELLSHLPDAPMPDSPADRSGIRVGILSALEMHRFAPFWNGLVRALGFTPVMPEGESGTQVRAKAWETVPSESVCYPAKLVHAKAFQLRESGVDAILFPAFKRGMHCAVATEYACALKDSVEWLRDGGTRLIAPCLSSAQPARILREPEDIAALKAELGSLAVRSGSPLEEGELERAVRFALQEQQRFEDELATKTGEALSVLAADPDAKAVLLAGRPYHLDPEVMHGIDEMLTELGFIVLGMTGLPEESGAPLGKDSGHPEWRPAKRLLRAARFVLDNPQVSLVCLQSFGCGYDAASLEEVKELLEANGRPFTALKLDEMVETAHIRIRLRTLAESLEAAKGSQASNALEAGEPNARERVAKGSKRLNIMDEPLDERDLAVARASTVKDACFTANAMAAHVIRLMRDDPDVEEVLVPRACKACLNEAIPRMVERAVGHAPRFVWTESIQVGRKPDAKPSDTGRPKVGLIGNPLLVFSPFMNDGVADLLDGLGCEVVLPEEEALYTEDVRYLDQLERFHALGVKHVIYLQSFGCVKGHAHARGVHYQLAELFPDMPVTVLDYDPEASALNRENRVRLIAESVLADSNEDPAR